MSGWEGAGGVKISQADGSLRTILPFFFNNIFIKNAFL